MYGIARGRAFTLRSVVPTSDELEADFGGDTDVSEMPLRPPAELAAVIHDAVPLHVEHETTRPIGSPPGRIVLTCHSWGDCQEA